MRKLILHMIVSTDGFISTGVRDVNPAAHWSEEIQDHYSDLFNRAGGVGFGRNLYEEYVGHYSKAAAGEILPETDLSLTTGDSYTFTVTATNANGTGPPSQPSAPVISLAVRIRASAVLGRTGSSVQLGASSALLGATDVAIKLDQP